MSSSLILPQQEEGQILEPYEIHELLNGRVDVVIDGGYCGHEPTTVIDLTSGYPEVVREGAGDSSAFE